MAHLIVKLSKASIGIRGILRAEIKRERFVSLTLGSAFENWLRNNFTDLNFDWLF